MSKIERQTIACYKAGLHDNISLELLMVRLVSIEEAYQLALHIEQGISLTRPNPSIEIATLRTPSPTKTTNLIMSWTPTVPGRAVIDRDTNKAKPK